MHLSLGCCPFLSGGSVVVDPLFIFTSIVCGASVFGPCFVMQYVMSLLLCFQEFSFSFF